ncbi:MAG: NUDIX hydrolase [Bacteroidales bacterium]
MLRNFSEIPIETLRNALRNSILPGEYAHTPILPPRRKPNSEINNKKSFIRSSTILLIYPHKGESYTCFIRRTSDMKHHAGQIGLPGGRREFMKESALQAAVRETEEEIGIPCNDIDVLGKLSNVYIPISNYKMEPFVGLLKHSPIFKINAGEIETLYTLPLQKVISTPISQIEMNYRGEKTKVPGFVHDDFIIWGATAMVINEFIELCKTLQLSNS